MWSTVDYLRAMFDELLPVPPIAEKSVIVWLTVDLEHPTETEGDASPVGKREMLRTVTQGRNAGFEFIGISQRLEDFGRKGQAVR